MNFDGDWIPKVGDTIRFVEHPRTTPQCWGLTAVIDDIDGDDINYMSLGCTVVDDPEGRWHSTSITTLVGQYADEGHGDFEWYIERYEPLQVPKFTSIEEADAWLSSLEQ